MRVFHFGFNRPSAFRSGFAPRKPRHRLARAALGLLGLGLLAVLVFFSVFVGAAMLAVGLVYRLWARRGQSLAREAKVVEGEFRIVNKTALPSA